MESRQNLGTTIPELTDDRIWTETELREGSKDACHTITMDDESDDPTESIRTSSAVG